MDDTLGPQAVKPKAGRQIAKPTAPKTPPEVPGVVSQKSYVHPTSTTVQDKKPYEPEEVVELDGVEEAIEEQEGTGLDTGLAETAETGIICPRCMWDTSLPVVEPTEEDKKDYLRCVLGGKPYSKTYEVFGGAVFLTFQERDNKLAQMREHQQKVDAIKVLAEVDEKMAGLEMLDKATKTRVATTLKRVRMGDEEKTIPDWKDLEEEDGVSVVQQLVLATFDGVSESLTNVFVNLARDFEALVDTLTQRAAESDFWTGVGQP